MRQICGFVKKILIGKNKLNYIQVDSLKADGHTNVAQTTSYLYNGTIRSACECTIGPVEDWAVRVLST